MIRADNTKSILDPKSEHVGAFDSTGIIVIPEDKGYLESKLQRQVLPEDPDGNYEDQLEASGATIIDSVTQFPASNTRLYKRSQTVEERAQEQEFNYYNDR